MSGSTDFWHVLQGVLGETYHFTYEGVTARAQDDPQAEVSVPRYINLMYPLFPDSAYELDSLFASPSFSFPSSFLHSMVMMRKAVVASLAKILPPPPPTPMPATLQSDVSGDSNVLLVVSPDSEQGQDAFPLKIVMRREILEKSTRRVRDTHLKP
eukprot:jgi/Botrbrau1/21283/Bobra.0755s0001.1